MKTLQELLDSKPLSFWIRFSDLNQKENCTNDEANELASAGREAFDVFEAETGKDFSRQTDSDISNLCESLVMSVNLYIGTKRGHLATKTKFSFNDLDNQAFSITELGKRHVEKDLLTR